MMNLSIASFCENYYIPEDVIQPLRERIGDIAARKRLLLLRAFKAFERGLVFTKVPISSRWTVQKEDLMRCIRSVHRSVKAGNTQNLTLFLVLHAIQLWPPAWRHVNNNEVLLSPVVFRYEQFSCFLMNITYSDFLRTYFGNNGFDQSTISTSKLLCELSMTSISDLIVFNEQPSTPNSFVEWLEHNISEIPFSEKQIRCIVSDLEADLEAYIHNYT